MSNQHSNHRMTTSTANNGQPPEADHTGHRFLTYGLGGGGKEQNVGGDRAA